MDPHPIQGVEGGGSRGSETTVSSGSLGLLAWLYLYLFVEAQTDIQPNREILAPPGVDTEQDKEQVLSIGKHPSLMKVIH